jgi:hypothetical protein
MWKRFTFYHERSFMRFSHIVNPKVPTSIEVTKLFREMAMC